jgi:hypothetical protein
VSDTRPDPPTGDGGPDGDAGRVRPFPGRKERGGFDPSRLGDASRAAPVVPQIVGSGPTPRPAPDSHAATPSARRPAPVPGPPPIVPPASPA